MTYAYGSVQSAHETSKLALNNFYWLGVMPKDLEEYKIEDTCTLPIKNEDIRRIEYMLKEPPIQNQDNLKEQLELMLKSKKKAEIQALSSRGFDFLIQYVINKIEKGDFIKF
jgi:DNA topoisomerase VI subunit A